MNHAHSIRWLTGVAALALLQGEALAQDARNPAPTTGDAAIAQAQGTRLNTTGKTIDIVVPLRERVPIGQVEIRIAPDDSVTISQRDLANAIRRGVTPQFVAAIEAIPSVGGFVTAQDVAAHGMLLAFDPSALDLTASRRLTLFTERSGTTAILLRTADPEAPSAAATRWRVAAAPSRALEANAPGAPTFTLDLLRQRGGAPSYGWTLEWDRDRTRFTPLSRDLVADAGGEYLAAG